MVILNDSTAREIRQILSERIASIGMFDDNNEIAGIAELIKALEPMTEPCLSCKHEYLAGYEEPCNSCVFANGTTCGYEWDVLPEAKA